MEPGAIFLLLLVLAFMVIFISRPFFVRGHVTSRGNSRELSALLAERERLLASLQDLDSDQALGKIPAEDYPAQRTELLQRGAEILRQIDSLVIVPANAGRVNVNGAEPATGSQVALTDELLEDLITMRRTQQKEKTGGFCPKCGKPVMLADSFCPSCGYALKATL